MGEFILIHYKPDHDLHYWVTGGGHHPSITLAHGTLQDMQPIARGKKVYIFLDANYTTIKSVKIPSKNRNKQLQAIPFALEDQIAEDIEDTFFAIGKTQASGQLPVIAIKRNLLQQTIEFFSSNGLKPDVISVDTLALPDNDNSWSVLLDKETALIKTANSQGYCCDRAILSDFLNALIDQSSEPADPVKIYTKQDDEQAKSLLDTVDLKFDYENYNNHPLEILALNLQPSLINLLQGEFSVKRENSLSWLRPWKLTAVFAAIWISLHLAYTGFMAHQLEQQNLQLAKEIEREFKRAMPEARKITNMKTRVERKLKELKRGSTAASSQGFLEILDKTAVILSQQKTITINAAIYRGNQLDMDLSAKALQDIEQLKNQLDKIAGIQTTLSTTVEKDIVKGRLRMEAKG